MSDKKDKILFLVQLPQPIHGVSIMNRSVVNSQLILENFTTKIIPLRFVTTIRDIGIISPIKLVLMVVVGVRILKACLFFRPKMVYLSLSPIGFAFYRDVLYVLILKIFGLRRVYHLHGKGIKDRAYKSRVARYLYRFVFRGSYIICLSESLKSDISSFSVKKVFVVNNGIEVIEK